MCLNICVIYSSRPIYLLKFWLPPPILYSYKRGGGGNQQATFYTTQVFRGLAFPFPVLTPPHLPINRSVNDHSFYWYVQTIIINIFFCIYQRVFRQTLSLWRTPRSIWLSVTISFVLDFLCRVVVRSAIFTSHEKATSIWTMLNYDFWKTFFTSELFPVPPAPFSSILNIVDMLMQFRS